MYKLLIAEDEEIFRKVLPSIIDWNSIGFEIIGVVEDGFEALKLLEQVEVDVILTDIRMPHINGLELAMEVKSRFPRIKTILLSAFNEFEYARKGIDCGVYGYLLKSDDEESIEKYFVKLSKVLSQENLIGKNDESLWGYREAFLKDIINNKDFDINTIFERGKLVYIDIPADKVFISVIRLDEYNSIVQTYSAGKVKSIIKTIRTFLVKNVELKKKGYIIELDDMICIIWNQPEAVFKQNVEALFKELTTEMSISEVIHGKELTVTFVCSGSINEFLSIGQVYNNILKAFKYRTYLGGNKILFITDFKDRNEPVMTFGEENNIIRKTQGLIQDENSNSVIQYFDELEEELVKKCFTDINQIITLSIKIILTVSSDVGRMRGNSSHEVFTKFSYQIREIGYCETIASVFGQIKAFLAEVIVLLNRENSPINKKIIEEAVRFIQENYAKSINLESVAKHVNVHPVHLSRLFSQDMGKTFKSVLTDIRIDEAKKMLMDINNKVYEVAFAVGYENPRYFSELFKNTTNLTPVEYREKFKC